MFYLLLLIIFSYFTFLQGPQNLCITECWVEGLSDSSSDSCDSSTQGISDALSPSSFFSPVSNQNPLSFNEDYHLKFALDFLVNRFALSENSLLQKIEEKINFISNKIDRLLFSPGAVSSEEESRFFLVLDNLTYCPSSIKSELGLISLTLRANAFFARYEKLLVSFLLLVGDIQEMVASARFVVVDSSQGFANRPDLRFCRAVAIQDKASKIIQDLKDFKQFLLRIVG